jgi:hypothetical protein
MRVRCTLREIKEELGLTTNDLQRELSVDARTLHKLIADTDSNPWRLDRETLYRYFLFARRYGFDPFRIEHDEIWKSFDNSEVIIFRGPKKADVLVESHLIKYFDMLNCDVSSSTAAVGIEDAMKQNNCVIVGQPNNNPASESCLALLWKAEPFQGEAENREKIPISFLGMQIEREEPSALLQESPRHGLRIRPPGFRERRDLNVDWPHESTGQDAAILVVCHKPLGTQKDVTTIVIAGYTGLATLVAAQEVTHERIPELQPEMMPGQPRLAALKFRYRKRRQSQPAVDKESVRWAPPWQDFFDA